MLVGGASLECVAERAKPSGVTRGAKALANRVSGTARPEEVVVWGRIQEGGGVGD